MHMPAHTTFRRQNARSTWALSFFAFLILFFASMTWAAPQPAASEQSEPSADSATSTDAPASYSELVETLEDPAARDKLIEQLRVLAEAEAAREGEADAAEIEPSGIAVFSHRIGGTLQAVTAQLGRDIELTLDAFQRIGTSDGVTEGKLEGWVPALRVLALVIVVTLIAYALLRAVARILFGRLNTWIQRKPAKAATAAAAPSATMGPESETIVTGPSSDAAVEQKTVVASRDTASHINKPEVVTTPKPGLTRTHLPRFGRITLSRKLMGVVLALVVDVGATLLAALVGYIAAAALSDSSAASGVFAFQFLTAFVLIEVVKSFSRAVFATRYDQLRLLPMQPDTASFWNRWITLLIALTGYCLLVVVPIGQAVFAPSIGRLIGLIIMLCVYVTGVRVVWGQRKAVKAAMMERADRIQTAFLGTLLRAFARIWHWLAIAYFTVLLVASQAEQAAALAFMVSATVQSLVAILIGAILAAGLTQLEARYIVLPEGWKQSFPMLERRINSYLDPALRGLRLH